MTAMAAACGFRVPFSKEINLAESLTDFADIPFPCILKPLKSSRGKKEDFRICHSYDQLTVALYDLQKHCGSVLLQEFIKPDFEILIIGIRSRKSGINVIPGMLHKVGTGHSTNNLGMTYYAYVEKELSPYVDIETVNKFLEKIDYDGIYSIEYFVSGGIAYFLEINLRTDATMYIYTTAGINAPDLWIKANSDSYEHKEVQIYKKRTYGMAEISYIKGLLHFNPIKILRDWWKTDCYSIFSWKDPLPFIYKLLYH